MNLDDAILFAAEWILLITCAQLAVLALVELRSALRQKA